MIGAHYDTVPRLNRRLRQLLGLGCPAGGGGTAGGPLLPLFSTVRGLWFRRKQGCTAAEYYVDSLSSEELEDIYLMINGSVPSIGVKARHPF